MSAFRERLERHACLVAAAPEMLAVLQDCHDYLDCIPESSAGGDDYAVSLARRVRRLLAKAQGKERK